MIILILISQYFYNNMRQVVTAFYLNPQLIVFFLSIFNNWSPIFCSGIFLKVLCQFQKFCSFIKKFFFLNILSKILAYFAFENEMKLFFLTLFFFINKKITSLLQPTNLYKYVSIYVIFFSFSLSRFSFLFFSLLLLFFYIQFQGSDYVYVYG